MITRISIVDHSHPSAASSLQWLLSKSHKGLLCKLRPNSWDILVTYLLDRNSGRKSLLWEWVKIHKISNDLNRKSRSNASRVTRMNWWAIQASHRFRTLFWTMTQSQSGLTLTTAKKRNASVANPTERKFSSLSPTSCPDIYTF